MDIVFFFPQIVAMAILGVLIGANAVGAIWLWYSIKKATNLREALAADWELRQVGKAAPKGYNDLYGYNSQLTIGTNTVAPSWIAPQTTTGKIAWMP